MHVRLAIALGVLYVAGCTTLTVHPIRELPTKAARSPRISAASWKKIALIVSLSEVRSGETTLVCRRPAVAWAKNHTYFDDAERLIQTRLDAALLEKGYRVVERVRLIKRHRKARQSSQQSGIIEMEAPIHASNLMVICPKCDRPSRIGRRILEDGTRVRVCGKCGEMLAGS